MFFQPVPTSFVSTLFIATNKWIPRIKSKTGQYNSGLLNFILKSSTVGRNGVWMFEFTLTCMFIFRHFAKSDKTNHYYHWKKIWLGRGMMWENLLKNPVFYHSTVLYGETKVLHRGGQMLYLKSGYQKVCAKLQDLYLNTTDNMMSFEEMKLIYNIENFCFFNSFNLRVLLKQTKITC